MQRRLILFAPLLLTLAGCQGGSGDAKAVSSSESDGTPAAGSSISSAAAGALHPLPGKEDAAPS
jgi:hypothetical protein